MISAAPLRVAVVGAGPAGFYCAAELLDGADGLVEVEVFDRLPTPWGLVRAGVAPDHAATKAVSSVFQRISALPGFRYHLNVEVGVDVTHDDLLAHHHAVIYANGAAGDRRLGIPGEGLVGSHAATQFVGWYNGHPDYADLQFDLTSRRVVIIGNGNVAFDVARILLLDPDQLAHTDIADHALATLRDSLVAEVVVVGRRGPAQAAFTSPELLALGDLPDVDIIVEPDAVADSPAASDRSDADTAAFAASLKQQIISEYAARVPTGAPKRLVLRFLSSPIEILGVDRVEGVRMTRNELVADPDCSLRARPTADIDTIETGFVLRSVGYRGTEVAGVPFDKHTATIANVAGRVVDPQSGIVVRGVYAAGWIKRGPSGVIGTNKHCARQTVAHVLDDYEAGRLRDPAGNRDALAHSIAARQPHAVGSREWKLIDLHECRCGQSRGRPRLKLVRTEQMLRIAQAHT